MNLTTVRRPINSLLCLLLFTLFPWSSEAFPLKLNSSFITVSEENSHIKVDDGVAGTTLKVRRTRFLGLGTYVAYELPLGPDVHIDIRDTIKKKGRVKIDGVTGDPLALLSGPTTEAVGTITITSEGVPGLFPVSVINLEFLGGSYAFGISLPGNQLIGPDGDDTFVSFTSRWRSLDPIGQVLADGILENIILGEFQINSIGRPSEFFYSLDADLSGGTMDFALGEVLITNADALPEERSTLQGDMRKTMTFRLIPEPPSWLLLVSGLGILVGWRRHRATR